MKTAWTIAQQESRKEDKNGAGEAQIISQSKGPVSEARRRSNANLKMFPPGVSGNPGGVPKHDLAKEIAKAVFENNPTMVYRAFCKAIAKGNAYSFEVLANRAYGKLKEHFEVEAGPYRDLTDDELRERIAKLEEQLGIPPAPVILDDDAVKPN